MSNLNKLTKETVTKQGKDTREEKLLAAYTQLSIESKTTIDILVDRLLKYELQEERQ